MSNNPNPTVSINRGSDASTRNGGQPDGTTRGNSGGRSGRNGGRGRNNRNNRARSNTNYSSRTGRTSSFKGDTEGMNGHVFECAFEHGDKRQYAKTVEALEAYAKKNYNFSEDFASLFAPEPSEPVVERPVDLPRERTETDEMIWKEEIKAYVSRSTILRSNLVAIFSVALGQCSEEMKRKLKTLKDYEGQCKKHDCLWLLKNIRSIMLQFDHTRKAHLALMEARENYLTCRQSQDQSTDEHLENLMLWVNTIEYHGGTVVDNYELASAIGPNGEPRTEAERKNAAREETIALALIRGADPTRYGTLIAELSNKFAAGRDEYPTDLTTAYNMLVTYRTPVNARVRNQMGGTVNNNNNHGQQGTSGTTEESAMTFTQNNSSTAGTTTDTPNPVTSISVPSSTTASVHTGTTLVQYAIMMAQSKASAIDPNWILLDSQSTISVFCNKDMLHNVRPSPHVLRAITNGGYQDSNMIGDFPNLGPVWYNEQSIANILALSDVRKVCTVTMDTAKAAAINVHRHDGSIMSFVEHPSGLYVYDSNKHTNNAVTAYTLVSTVAEHKRMFSQRQIDAADTARALYRKLGRPDEAEFQSILRNNLIRNCPVSPDDARRALHIYGPDVAVLKGKMTRSGASPRAPTFEAVPLPAPILQHQRNVTLCVDFFFVQGIGFLHTISRGIGFRTVTPIVDRTRLTIQKELNLVIKLYQHRGLRIQDIHADNEFECVRNVLRPLNLNIVPADSHVGEIERSIRTIKERLRSCVHGLPYKRLPKLMIRHMVADVVRCLNQFPHRNGISSTMSPATIVVGTGTPNYNAMRLEFGAYVQVFEDLNPTNTPRARSLGAIALNPTGNAQGDYYFMSLASGARLSRHRWTELPIPDTAIARVEALALEDGQPLIQDSGLVIEWRPDHAIDESEYDRDYIPNHAATEPDDLDLHPNDFEPVDAAELAALADHDVPPFDVPIAEPERGAAIDENLEAIDEDNNDEDAVEYDSDDGDVNDETNDDDMQEANEAAIYEAQGASEDEEVFEEEQSENGAIDENQGAHADGETQEGEGQLTPTNVGTPQRYNLRGRRTHATTTNFRDAIDEPYSNASYFPPTQHQLHQVGHVRDHGKFAFDYIMTGLMEMTGADNKRGAYVLTQMTAKAGIRKYGKAAEAALMKEFTQMEDLNVYEPIQAITLTKEQRKAALRVLSLIQEKRCGTLKSRTVADGRPQRKLYDRSETASPTVSTDGLLLTIIIDAYESRDVATADVAGAYLKAFMKDFVVMKFTGEMVDILCKLNPKYKDFIVLEGNIPVIYVRLVKAIYGCVQSALLWYELFSGTLQKMGFVLNPYDKCVANCNVHGKQCTIAWYVDDTKISHEDPDVVTMMIKKLENVFGKMTVTRGSSHVFLGMNIQYNREERNARITMKDYLDEAIIESELDITREAATPANKELFDVDQTSATLNKRHGEVFHSVVAKLLYVSIRARMDLLLATSFLTTRVSKSTEQDMAKLKRLLEYINGTRDMEYIVGADHLGRMRTWVDAAYAVHPDMRSHTGGMISFGRGGVACKSSKQKLNTKSSTEAEFVGASDYLPNTIWVKLFMEAQGHKITHNILEQDNESAIRLEKNGRTSAGPKSRHINIRYFWIKDRTNAEKIQIRHCPTLQMIADFFTKPLQGNLFKRFRDVVLGHEHVDTLALVTTTPGQPEERVGIPSKLHKLEQPKPRATGSSNNGIGTYNSSESGSTRSWADVVKGGRGKENDLSSTCVSNKTNQNFEGSFSRSNPVD